MSAQRDGGRVQGPWPSRSCAIGPLQTRYLVNNAKVTDHHAIIPTEEQPDLWRLTGPERNIYDLVVRRFLAVLLPPFTYEEIRLTMTVDGETFTARGKIVKDQGWKAAYSRFTLEEDEGAAEDEDAEQNLPPLSQGDKIKLTGLQINAGKTAPPKRYTEATLLTAMEHPQAQVKDAEQSRILEETGGLGTPATRADIIEKLFSAFYIERRGKELYPTSKGIQVVSWPLPTCAAPSSPPKWEKRLGDIAQGREKESAFVGEMRSYASRLVSEVKASDASYSPRQPDPHPMPRLRQVPAQGQDQSGGRCWCVPTGSAATAAASSRSPTPAAPTAIRRWSCGARGRSRCSPVCAATGRS